MTRRISFEDVLFWLIGGIICLMIGTMVVAAVGGALAFVWLLPSPVVSTRTLDDLEVPAEVG